MMAPPGQVTESTTTSLSTVMDYSGSSTQPTTGSFVITRSWAGNYVWTLRDADGRVLETSTSRFGSYDECRRAVERIRRVAANAVIQESLVRQPRLSARKRGSDAGQT